MERGSNSINSSKSKGVCRVNFLQTSRGEFLLLASYNRGSFLLRFDFRRRVEADIYVLVTLVVACLLLLPVVAHDMAYDGLYKVAGDGVPDE